MIRSAGQVIEDVIIPLGAKPLEARGEAASPYTKVTGCLFVCVFVPKDLANR